MSKNLSDGLITTPIAITNYLLAGKLFGLIECSWFMVFSPLLSYALAFLLVWFCCSVFSERKAANE